MIHFLGRACLCSSAQGQSLGKMSIVDNLTLLLNLDIIIPMRPRRRKDGEMRSNTIVVFGGGALENPDGSRIISPASEQRADHALRLYRKNPEQLRRIILTGGAGLTAVGMELPTDESWSEARLMADYLTVNDVPHYLVETEINSTSTTTNITNILEAGLVVLDELSPEKPLGLVSHPNHLNRISDTFHTLEIKDLEKLPTPEKDNYLRELAHRALNRAILFGIDNITGSNDAKTLQLRINALKQRDKALAETLRYLRQHRLPSILRPSRA